jgi:hypothetical protein
MRYDYKYLLVLLLVTTLCGFYKSVQLGILFLCIYIVVCIILYLLSTRENRHYYTYKSTTSRIPCVVYTYWHDTNFPSTVQKCITSWKKYLPTYTIHIITKDTISQYVPFDVYALRHADQSQRISDFIRLYMLSVHGGIWMDASVYLNDSLDWVHGYQQKTQCEFIGFELEGILPNIESWFLACIPSSTFIKDWKDTFYNINNYETIQEYITMISKTTNLSCLEDPHYLSIYVASQFLLQKPNTYKLCLFSANGPFSINLIYWFPFLLSSKEPVIKYTRNTRRFLEWTRLHHFL